MDNDDLIIRAKRLLDDVHSEGRCEWLFNKNTGDILCRMVESGSFADPIAYNVGNECDAELIAAAPRLVQELLDRIEKLQGVVRKARLMLAVEMRDDEANELLNDMKKAND